jgi:hypothetical protein
MSEINKKLFRFGLIYGLLLAGIQILLQLLIYVLDIDMFSITFGMVNFLVTILIISIVMVYANVKFRDKYLEKKTNFIKCWMIALIIGLVSMLILTIYNYLFTKFFDPELLKEQASKAMEMIDSNANIPDEDKAKIIQKMNSRFTPELMILQSLMFMGTLSFSLSLLSTLFVRKKEKVQENIY